jgi:hypothetical protein
MSAITNVKFSGSSKKVLITKIENLAKICNNLDLRLPSCKFGKLQIVKLQKNTTLKIFFKTTENQIPKVSMI